MLLLLQESCWLNLIDNITTMKSGTCPKCQSSEVFNNSSHPTRGDRASIAGADGRVRSNLYVNVYVCADCGYVEEYVREDILNDQEKMERLRSTWKKD